MTFKVIGGTPRQHGKSLCDSCRWAFIKKGFREKDAEIICGGGGEGARHVVNFPVAECNEYDKKGAMTKSELEAIALIIDPARVRMTGFAPKD